MERMLPPSTHAAIGVAIDQVYRLTPYAERTVVLVPQRVLDKVSTLASLAGFDEKITSFALAMFLCYPLGFAMSLLPFGRMKHLASFFFGIFILQFTLGGQWINQLISSLIAYMLLLSLPPHHARLAVPAFAMCYLSLGHLHRQYTSYINWDLDFTMSQMILTIKLYSLSYNLYDGVALREAKNQADKRVTLATQKCAQFAIENVPTLLEFLGYTFCFSTVLAGPAFEYKVYAGACSGEIFRLPHYANQSDSKMKLPSRFGPTLRPFISSIICMMLYMIGTEKFPLFDPIDPAHRPPAILQEDFLSLPLLQRLAYVYISLLLVKMRYYFPWKSAEGSTNIWYGGFEGFDENGSPKGFAHSSNVDIWAAEMGGHREVTKNLNKKTASWLMRYVYMRTGGSMFVTFLFSACWHGFYAGYYLFFLVVPLAMSCERMTKKKVMPHLNSLPSISLIWRAITFTNVRFIQLYSSVPFFVLSWKWSLAWYRSLEFCGHQLLLFQYFILLLMPSSREKVS